MKIESFEGLSAADASEFAASWLPAWTGNDPERLASFYTDDAFYSDPAVPDGVRGRDALLDYFRALLARFPDWEWSMVEATPMVRGFLNHWHATIPVGDHVIEVDGVCTVALRDGLIERNQVYFDRSALLAAMADQP
ncbi:MAG TPA: nuclear transport factor 2 family protein [Solirubrobacterales bacterium]|nr:nuclear transport factor 2 family protein [Solirubrobacterales bacterium]